MRGEITYALAVEAGDWPDHAMLEGLVEKCFDSVRNKVIDGFKPGCVSILFTDDSHMQALNRHWRGRDKPTNVLSFPADFPALPEGDAAQQPLGDIVLAYETCLAEAKIRQIPFENHLAHLILHGIMHLFGFDHQNEAEAIIMEDIERRCLAAMAIPDPY